MGEAAKLGVVVAVAAVVVKYRVRENWRNVEEEKRNMLKGLGNNNLLILFIRLVAIRRSRINN